MLITSLTGCPLHGRVASRDLLTAFIWYERITNPEDAEVVLNTCLEKDYLYHFTSPWIGKGLITADVPTWRRHHKLLAPAFNRNVLNGFMGVFNRQSSVMVEAMAKELGRERFDASVYIGAATLEMICQTAMGTPMDQLSIASPLYLEATQKIMDLLSKRVTSFWLHPQFIYNLLGYKKIEDDTLRILHHVSNTHHMCLTYNTTQASDMLNKAHHQNLCSKVHQRATSVKNRCAPKQQ
ncbi:Cytochrome P450 4C1 [Eumeta japonica]|uniref:Cytochrome P450 4C1 n=1 Tax=Eumeta variegata TaxID=151549 RepID=A0A4C1WU09_EUMVA|nr:Cytochrome P450 4C1 [Eumeta japonica]